MRKLYFQVLAVVFFLSLAVPVLARENVNYWYIRDFQSEIVVNKDASLDITEKIVADCGTAEGKHGIFRVLPLKYKTTGETFLLPTEVISVTDFNNNKLEYKITKDKETLTIKIGSADVVVRGVNNYIIKYHVKNAIRTGNAEFDELYWNLSGNFWDIEIDNFATACNRGGDFNDFRLYNYKCSFIGRRRFIVEWFDNFGFRNPDAEAKFGGHRIELAHQRFQIVYGHS